MKPPLYKLAGVAVLGFLRGLWEGLSDSHSGDLAAGALEAGLTPVIPKLRLPAGTFPVPQALAALVGGVRPLKYKNAAKPELLISSQKPLQEKIGGILVQVVVDKNGNVTRAFAPSGEKADFLHALPDLKAAKLDPAVRDSKIFVEVFHPKGREWLMGVFNSKPENAQKAIAESGHPTLYTLFVGKLGGFDTSTHKYPEMRSLTELVARKLPHGAVPAECRGPEVDRKAFIDKVRKENEGQPVQKCDGVVAYPVDQPLKGAVIERFKFPMTERFVVLGFQDSTKMKDAVASLIVGDGTKRVGKVHVADPGMRTTIRLNPDRYLNKSVLVEYSRKTAKGALVNPILRRFFFADQPTQAVPKTEVKAG